MTVRSYYGLHQEPSQSIISNNIYNYIIKKLYEAIKNSPNKLVHQPFQISTTSYEYIP